MKPLQPIALGLAIVMLVVGFKGYDVLADSAGWLLVLLGVRDLAVERRGALLLTAGVCLVVSAGLWWPSVLDWFDDRHESLLWAVNLPQALFAGLLAHELSRRARAEGDSAAAVWLRIVVVATVVVAVLPIVVFGAGVRDLEPAAYVIASLSLLTLVVLLLTYAGRPWARSRHVS
ncbi:hypothetical protein DDE18_00470 [Nocardioides gansuensis]|uniref:Uncharacterized protein n=1 Tax=Nocardioides gansuensis TaxID=2138300 RepID=A0A2T8FEM9_9ACTN|nr:hypothetical protein [Nocardioides gansuensis]PVG84153.1 hypothetical protein DDE18_00470 [Nocardioides gansuensis]